MINVIKNAEYYQKKEFHRFYPLLYPLANGLTFILNLDERAR